MTRTLLTFVGGGLSCNVISPNTANSVTCPACTRACIVSVICISIAPAAAVAVAVAVDVAVAVAAVMADVGDIGVLALLAARLLMDGDACMVGCAVIGDDDPCDADVGVPSISNGALADSTSVGSVLMVGVLVCFFMGESAGGALVDVDVGEASSDLVSSAPRSMRMYEET